MAIKVKKELEILISVQAKELEELRKKLKDLPDTAKKSGKAVGTSFSNGLKSVAGLLAGGAFIAAVKNIFSEAISQSRKFEQAIIGLRATAKQTGTDFDELRKGIEKLSKDGQIGIDSLSRTVSSLLKQGLSVEKAFQFAEATKRIAAFTRTTDTLAQSQEDFTKALALGSMELGENLGSFGRVVKEMGGWVKVSSDMATKQKFVNIVIAEASKLGQDYVENFLQSGTAQQARFNLELAKAAAQLGDVLAPAIVKVLGFASGLIKSFQDLSERSKLLISIVPIIVGIIGSFIAWTITVGGLSAAFAILWGAIMGPITLVIVAIVGITAAIVGISEAMKDTKTESEKLADSIVKLGNTQNKTKAQTKKLKTEIDKLGKSYKKLAENILNSNISLSDQKTLMEDISKLEGLSREQSLIQTTGIINAMNARMLFLEQLNRREIAAGNIEEFTFGEDVPSPLIRMGIESGPQIRLLRQRLVLQEKLKQSLLNQTEAQKKFNEETGGGGKRAKKILDDNVFLLNKWEQRARAILDLARKEFDILIKNNGLIRKGGESQAEFKNRVDNTSDAQKEVNRQLQTQELILRTNLALLDLSIDRLNTGLGGFRDGLQGISDKDMPAVISGIGGMVMAFDPLIGGIVIGLGATLDILGDILSKEDELEEKRKQEKKQIDRTIDLEEKRLGILRARIALAETLLNIENANTNLVKEKLDLDIKLAESFGTPEDVLEALENALEEFSKPIVIRTGQQQPGENFFENKVLQTIDTVTSLIINNLELLTKAVGEDFDITTQAGIELVTNFITKAREKISPLGIASSLISDFDLVSASDEDIREAVRFLRFSEGTRRNEGALESADLLESLLSFNREERKKRLPAFDARRESALASIQLEITDLTSEISSAQALINIGLGIINQKEVIASIAAQDSLDELVDISEAAALTIDANIFTQEKISKQEGESDEELLQRQFESDIELAEKNKVIADEALTKIRDLTDITAEVLKLTEKINDSDDEFEKERFQNVIDAIKFAESQNDILQGIFDENEKTALNTGATAKAVLQTTAIRAGADFFSIDPAQIFKGGNIFQLNPDALNLDKASIGLAVTTQAVQRLTPELRTAEATERTADATEAMLDFLSQIRDNTFPQNSNLIELSENLQELFSRTGS